MSGPVLVVSNVSKSYVTHRSTLGRVASWFGFLARPLHEFRAVQDVSLRLEAGQAIALVGPNGAGKSTLLKMISGVVKPTSGSIYVSGRVGAILELGLGFNPEFTGRENAINACSMMGVPPSELEEVVSDIIAFVELGTFFDQPLRTYSSGMAARLAFAAATAVKPTLLVVDEVLSVGDAYFQAKSFARFRRLISDGSSVVMVSHDLDTVKSICTYAYLIDAGRVEQEGPAPELCDYYQAMVSSKLETESIRRDFREGRVITRSGSGKVVIESVRLSREDAPDKHLEIFDTGTNVVLTVVLSIEEDIPSLTQGFLIRDRRGNDVFGTNTFHLKHSIKKLRRGQRTEIRFSFALDLGEGIYSLSIASVNSDIALIENYNWLENILAFEVVNEKKTYSIGSAILDVKSTHRLVCGRIQAETGDN